MPPRHSSQNEWFAGQSIAVPSDSAVVSVVQPVAATLVHAVFLLGLDARPAAFCQPLLRHNLLRACVNHSSFLFEDDIRSI